MKTDAELLDAWRSGHARAGAALFARHRAAVFRMFANKAGADVDDLVQRTFLACVERREEIRDGASFRAWLLRVARNELLMYFRRRSGRPADTSVDAVAALGTTPSRQLAAREAERRLSEAVRSLPVVIQVALELHYFEDLSGSEVAQVLEVPEGTVRSRIRRGLAMLRERLPELES